MRGWQPLPAIPGGHMDVQQCTAENCGATVRVLKEKGRREQHDREFHLVTVLAGGPMDGYLLHLDGKEIGYVYKKRETYNLARYLVSETWVASLTGQPRVGGRPTLRETMTDVVRHLDGAKAWGRGKTPSTWIYPSEESR